MRPRFRLPRLVAALATLLAAACTDESPLLVGDSYFPDGRPVTREVILPAEFTALGSFTGYTGPRNAGYMLLANQYEGGLDSHGLVRFPGAVPEYIEYEVEGATRRDSAYTVVDARVVLVLDTLATDVGGDGTAELQLLRLAQPWSDTTATWQVAVDSAGVQTPWAQPGGSTTGAPLGGVYVGADPGDSVAITVDSATVRRARESGFPGFLLRSAEPDTRVTVLSATFRMLARPRDRDTTILLSQTSLSTNNTFIFTPEPPAAGGLLQVGGIRSARSLFGLRLPDSVQACPTAQSCRSLPLSALTLNRVSLLLRPLPVPGGYRATDTSAVTLYGVHEPELGGRAPLGLDPNVRYSGARALARFAPGDSVAELPMTGYALGVARNDTTLPTSFALLAATAYANRGQPEFGVVHLDTVARLRIIFTLPDSLGLP